MKLLKVVGHNNDGVEIVSGVFKLYDTCGMPLDLIFDYLKDNNMMPSWIHFYEDAVNGGWKDKTINLRLNEAILDVYGKDFFNQWNTKFEYYKENRKDLKAILKV